MGSELSKERCIPCEGGALALSCDEANDHLDGDAGWILNEGCTHISKEVKTKDFVSSLELANAIGDLAESEGHHPDLQVSFGTLGIELTTHAIKGLSRNDFIMAAKIDELLKVHSTLIKT